MRRATVLVVIGLMAGWPSVGSAQSSALAALALIGEGVESLANGLRTLVEAWDSGLELQDQQRCRARKQSFRSIAATLNLLAVDKTMLVDRLERFSAGPAPDAWGAVQEIARLIQSDLDQLTERMRRLAEDFSAPPALGAAYRDILLSLEARKSLLMQGIDELSFVERAPSEADAGQFAAIAAGLRAELAVLESGIAAMGEAVERPCPQSG